PFRNKNPASCDLRDRQFDGIRMGQQSVTITCVGKRRPPLQVFKLLLFGGKRLANQKIPHSALSYTGKNKLWSFQWLASRCCSLSWEGVQTPASKLHASVASTG